MRKFNVAGITFALKQKPELYMYRPTGAVTFEAEPDNPSDKNAVAIYHNGNKLGYVPADKPDLQKFCKESGVGLVSSYKYHHPDWKELSIPKWNDKHMGQLKSIEIEVDLAPEKESDVIGGRYMRVTSFLSYLNTSGTCDNLIRWAFGKGNTFEEYKEALDETAENGTLMHEAIEKFFDADSFRSDLLPEGWDKFVQKYEPEFVYGEERFKDNQLMLTGQPDFVGYIKYKGRKVSAILDWKSSKAVQLKHRLQIAIYNKNAYVDGINPEVSMVVAFGANNKQKYSVSVLDKDDIENYYQASKLLKEVINLTGCKVDESKYL